MSRVSFFALLGALVLPVGSSFAAEVGPAKSTTNAPPLDLAASWKEGETAIKKFRVAPGFKIELVAADPQLQNAVAFCFDNKGRIYTSQTGRYRSSVLDIRNYMSWYDDDLAARTVEDRVAMTKKHLGEDWPKMQLETETIKVLEDNDHDGRYDTSRIFAAGFTNMLDGIASGVMAWGTNVYFTSIPDLWMLPAASANGPSKDTVARERKSVAHGFGVHFSLTGHDLHGLIMGPDGRVYFTIGDRGTHLTTKEGKIIDLPDEGACFRMEPDGSHLEVFARGLRNPQELAFDEFGNLFTGENDCDHGDRERWVHIVEGADYGWRIGYQFSEQNPGGAWMSERLWWTNFPGRAAYCLPPLAHIENGPSGISYYPGTGLPDSFNNTFFVTHFKGVDNVSGIRMLKTQPRGASFQVTSDEELIWNTLPTDVDFSPDGKIHFSDWVHGWPKSEKGRIYRMVHEKEDPRAKETATLLGDGMERRQTKDLIRLLEHPDMRVRLAAQFALAERPRDDKAEEVKALVGTALKGKSPRARRHAIWAIGQIARRLKEDQLLEDLHQLEILVKDEDPHVRAAVANTFSEAGYSNAKLLISKLLADGDPRVRAEAALALAFWDSPRSKYRLWQTGQEKLRDAVVPEVDRLKNSVTGGKTSRGVKISSWRWPLEETIRLFSDAGAYDDPALRHAGTALLASYLRDTRKHQKGAALQFWGMDQLATNASPSVRLGMVLSLRVAQESAVAHFASDPDPIVAVEAARAINDAPINDAMPTLAQVLNDSAQLQRLRSQKNAPTITTAKDHHDLVVRPFVRRALNANFRVGRKENADTLTKVALDASFHDDFRSEALLMLGQWANPSPRDKVIGLWRPLETRDPSPAVTAMRPALPSLLTNSSEAVTIAAIKAAAQLKLADASPLLSQVISKNAATVPIRVEALRALAVLQPKTELLETALKSAAIDPAEALRKEAARLSASSNPNAAAPELAKIIESKTTSFAEKQGALAALATIDGTVADEIIYRQFRPMVEGEPTPRELVLDIIEASLVRKDERFKEQIAKYQASLSKDDPLAQYRLALHGGNAEAGKKLFVERAELSCVRCHKINGEGGDVGPDLSKIGAQKDRDYLLGSLVLPNKEIAAGFESVVVTMKDGTTYAGVIKGDSAETLELNSPEDGLLKLKKADITARDKGLSGMPDGLVEMISKQDLRDLVEYLASLK